MQSLKALLLLTLFAPLLSHAQVTAMLVAADTSVRPGHALTVAVVLEHEPTWHTYWVNAGTGYPTSISWELPEGWSAGPISWPTPTTITGDDGSVTGNGYMGVLYLPVVLLPPLNAVPGRPVTLTAHVSWLMCSDQCIPGQDTATLKLNVSAQSPVANPEVRAELAKMPMPRLAPAQAISASRLGQRVILRIAGVQSLRPPHFFSEDGYIQYDEPQGVAAGERYTELTLTVSGDANPDVARLVGVLAYTGADGVYQGMSVDTPLAGSSRAPTSGVARTDSRAEMPLSGGRLAGGGTSGSAEVWTTLLFALVGGLILNLMPCVFPVLGIKIMGFVGHAGNDRRKMVLHGLAYALGVILSFWVLAGVLALLRAGGAQLAWGFQLQSPPFVFVLAVVMLVFALSLSGVFEFGTSVMGLGSSGPPPQGVAGSFATGVLATLVATPCSAPLLAPALGAALAVPATESFFIFTAIAVGLSLPYLLLSIFPQAVAWLPRPGRWMETFKQLMAFPLYATVGYLIWILAGQTSDNGLLMVLLGLTVIAMAVWLYGRSVVPASSGLRTRLSLLAASVLMVAGVQLGWPARAASSADMRWEPWSAERVTQLRAAGRPIYVDFTARWCATCQVNRKIVFTSQEVRTYLREHDVATLTADWTNSDPRITAELEKWHRGSVPFDLIYLPGRPEPLVLPEVLSPGTVLRAFHHNGPRP